MVATDVASRGIGMIATQISYSPLHLSLCFSFTVSRSLRSLLHLVCSFVLQTSTRALCTYMTFLSRAVNLLPQVYQPDVSLGDSARWTRCFSLSLLYL